MKHVRKNFCQKISILWDRILWHTSCALLFVKASWASMTVLRPQKCSLSVSVTDKYFRTSWEQLGMLLAWSQIKRIFPKKIDFFWGRIFSNLHFFGLFLVIFADAPELSGLRKTHKHILWSNEVCHVLSHILYDLRIHYGGIPSIVCGYFWEKRLGGGEGGVFPPFPI